MAPDELARRIAAALAPLARAVRDDLDDLRAFARVAASWLP